ncbi:SA-2 [Drosophila busckii]|uniref:SA-2 n=1 Tax=Drosophila busckii TaxID=30019 RepID=A0A0M4EX76_DROBS|nr:cohesin subunit SA-1 [Drosophila busckii]ALC42850.1 SA-2 [Drosophila busckii]
MVLPEEILRTEVLEATELDARCESLDDVGSGPEKEDSLLKLVCSQKCRTESVCEMWITLYRTSCNVAFIRFVQFVLEASGSRYRIPETTEPPFDFAGLLVEATVHFANRSVAYPLILKSSRMFVQSVGDFVLQLFRLVGSTSILLDGYFLEHISGFLMICADSKVRPFRHTSTMIALKMMTALSDLRCVPAELWLQLFDEIFLARSSDVVEDIRYLCVVECRQWLDKCPESFLQAEHVKHMFHALQDNCSKVCECSLEALTQIIQHPELRETCLQKCLEYRLTLLGLAMSRESEVAVLAIQVLNQCYTNMPEILDDSMEQVLQQLVFGAHRGVAQAAAKLIQLHRGADATEEERLRSLVEFFMQFGEHEHAAYMVDAFYGQSDIVLAWPAMVDMLLKPNYLSCQETSVMVEILVRAVKQAVTGEIPPGRYTQDLRRQPLPNGGKLATASLLSRLTTLLSQSRGRGHDLINILELPQYMDLEDSSELHLLELLEKIKEIMFEQDNLVVLQMSAMTLDHLYSHSSTHAHHCQKLLNDAVTNYRIAFKTWQQASDKAATIGHGGDGIRRLIVTLRLLHSLYARFDLSQWQLISPILSMLQQTIGAATEQRIPAVALGLYLGILYVGISWALKRQKDVDEDTVAGQTLLAADCEAIQGSLQGFLGVNFLLIEHSPAIKVSCDAFVYCCDLLVLFSDSLRQSSSAAIRALEYRSEVREYRLLEGFLLRYVFAGADENEGDAQQLLESDMFSVLQSKRRVLASYCKLVFHNVMPAMHACIMFQYYEKYNPVFGDIMRSTLEHCLSINATNFGMTLMHTCMLVYKRIRAAHKDAIEASASPEFANLLKLAELLGEVFNIKLLDSRPGVLVLHRAGISFAAELKPQDPANAPENLLFLSVIQQFVPQLLAQDMFEVLQFMQGINEAALLSNRSAAWEPYLSYRNCLEISLMQSCRRAEFQDLSNNVE